MLLMLVGASACSGAGPTAPQTPEVRLSVSGLVVERLAGTPIGGSTILFRGPSVASTEVAADGRYELHDLVPGEYEVTLSSVAHVPHETHGVSLAGSSQLRFSVIGRGTSQHGATVDETFTRFFHQLARVGTGTGYLRKWVVRPNELYLVEDTIPKDQFDVLVTEVEKINQDVLPKLWCDWIGPLQIRRGPSPMSDVEGRIVVTPNWNTTASGSFGETQIRTGRVAINVFRPGENRLHTRQEIRGLLAHELFHVAGAYHVCGGSLGENPFGFGPANCPYPDSLMANLGPLVETPSPEDRLASCLVYAGDTLPGNRYQDINPYYAGR